MNGAERLFALQLAGSYRNTHTDAVTIRNVRRTLPVIPQGALYRLACLWQWCYYAAPTHCRRNSPSLPPLPRPRDSGWQAPPHPVRAGAGYRLAVTSSQPSLPLSTYPSFRAMLAAVPRSTSKRQDCILFAEWP